MKDVAAPIPVQFTITLTALVYPEPEAGGYYPGKKVSHPCTY